MALEKIIKKDFSEIMTKDFGSYAVSVLKERNFPDVLDGFKTVQRRTLFAMIILGLQPEKEFRKAVRIVGEVLGKFHPHGDQSVYEAMVRMAQDFSLRYPLIWGQGNFGSIDDDKPAAMRYTEAKLRPIAVECFEGIAKNTVNFNLNFDETEKEPEILPVPFPQLLVNGAEGVAVGFATKIPTHNLSEVCDATIMLIENPNATLDELMEVLLGPDFPTGGIIHGTSGIRDFYEKGTGKFTVRAKAKILTEGKVKFIQITEIPYKVKKNALVEDIASVIKADEGLNSQVAQVRDESDLNGMSIIIEMKKNASIEPEQVLEFLYKKTNLQTKFNANFYAFDNPATEFVHKYTLKEYLNTFIEFRRDVVTKELNFDLQKLRERIEILEGLIKVLDDIDKAISIIRGSKDVKEAKKELMQAFDLTERQAIAVLDIKLQRLCRLEQETLHKELKAKQKEASKLEKILGSKKKLDKCIIDKLQSIKEKYGDKRRTVIKKRDLKKADVPVSFVVERNLAIEISKNGYIAFSGAGKGNFINISDGDELFAHFDAKSTDVLCFITDKGEIFRKAVSEMEAKRTKHIGNIFTQFSGNMVAVLLNPEDIILAMDSGLIKRLKGKDLAPTRQGVSIVKLKDEEKVLSASNYDANGVMVMVNSDYKGITFKMSGINAQGRAAAGVSGMKSESPVIFAKVVTGPIMFKTAKGEATMIQPTDLKVQNRGGKGMILFKPKKADKDIVVGMVGESGGIA